MTHSSKAIQKQLNQRATTLSGTGELARHGSDELKKTYVKHAGDAGQIADAYTQLTAKAGQTPEAAEDVTVVLAAQRQLRAGLRQDITRNLAEFNERSSVPEQPKPSFLGDVKSVIWLGTLKKKK